MTREEAFDKLEAYENADLIKRSEAVETVANIGSFYDEEGRSVDDYDDKAEIVSDWFSHIPRFEPMKGSDK